MNRDHGRSGGGGGSKGSGGGGTEGNRRGGGKGKPPRGGDRGRSQRGPGEGDKRAPSARSEGRKPFLNKQGRPVPRAMPKPQGDPSAKHSSKAKSAASSPSAPTEPRERRPAPIQHSAPLALPNAAALPPTEEFLALAHEAGIEFESGDVEKLGLYLALLLEVNKSTNLTAIEDPALAWKRHIFDSLTLIPALAELPEGSRVIDVGTGGGLPGIPLAICLPHLSFTLLESTGKKVEFLRQVASRLGLKNTVAIGERAEVLAHDRGEKVSEGAKTFREGAHRESYDAVVARAVGRLPTLLELTVPFARLSTPERPGRVLLIKGEQADAELAEAKGAMHLLKVAHASTLETPTGRIVVLEKPSATPKNYPRPNGEPKRVPLGVEKR